MKIQKLLELICAAVISILIILPTVIQAENTSIQNPAKEECSEQTDPLGNRYFKLLPVINENEELVSQNALVIGATSTLSSIPKLHSNPSATAKIFLDFDGHVTTDSLWNFLTENPKIITPAYSIDPDTTTFNEIELENIKKIWQRVSEDYLPFNVDVTTEEPPLISAKQAFRVVIGGSYNDWFGQSSGGVCYLGSWIWDNMPCFVFENNLGNGQEKYVAEAISHEMGHALSLEHQSIYDSNNNLISSYNDGFGYGETGWAPIMGVAYHQNLSTWHYGTTRRATSFQDDLYIITGLRNGFGYRLDDHGNTNALATPFSVGLSTNGITLKGSGVIERANDVDVFSFTTTAGTVTFSAMPNSIGPNLDISLELQNSAGKRLAIAELADTLSSSLSTNLVPGTYYLRVRNNGLYGRLGRYTISGEVDSTNLVSRTISGTVMLNGAPLAGVTIKGGVLGTRTTNSLGKFSFKGLDNGITYKLTLSKTGYSFNPSSTSGTLISDVNYNFSASIITYTLSGTVLFQGTPLSGVFVYSDTLGVRTTDSSGKYSFSGIKSGTAYLLNLYYQPGYSFSQNPISGVLTGNTTNSITASIITHTISGIVTDKGIPLPGVVIDGGSLGTQITDQNGKFTFVAVPYGTKYNIVATKKGYTFTTAYFKYSTSYYGTLVSDISSQDFITK